MTAPFDKMTNTRDYRYIDLGLDDKLKEYPKSLPGCNAPTKPSTSNDSRKTPFVDFNLALANGYAGGESFQEPTTAFSFA
ncbi:hypothetical protein B0A49_03796 [Cryomyces minteri]|uniref:Uncharacterized protein n=1 Tax=Cryomyces minteri TaxID=331657 RepID=A0A4U0XNF2_9PEZI|nr:hypothetical protein B0A49_03796 [Cryomyces minteri]